MLDVGTLRQQEVEVARMQATIKTIGLYLAEHDFLRDASFFFEISASLTEAKARIQGLAYDATPGPKVGPYSP